MIAEPPAVMTVEQPQVTPFCERIGDKLRFNFHMGQDRAWASEKRFVALFCGTQSGKTCFEPVWLDREMRIRGPGEYLASSSNFPLFELKFLPEMLKFFIGYLQWGTYNAGKGTLTSNAGACEADKTTIYLRSAHNPEALESGTFKAAVLDEWGQSCVNLQAWEAVQRRLSINQGRVLIGTTPYNLGWIKNQVYDRWVGGDPDYDVISFASTMNPVFPKAEFERMRRILPDWKFRMFYCGEFQKPAGLIYRDFDDGYASFDKPILDPSGAWSGARWNGGGHLVKPFKIPGAWMRTVGLDFGGVNHAQLWIAQPPGTDDYFVYRDILTGGKSNPEYAREATEYKEPVEAWVGGSKSEQAFRDEWALVGVPVHEPRITDLEAGIDHTIGLFRQHRLFIMDTCIRLRSDLGTYSRETDGAGEPTEKIEDKQKFHMADALRYGASWFPIDRRPLESEPLPMHSGDAMLHQGRRRR
jgi:hypothetical protein